MTDDTSAPDRGLKSPSDAFDDLRREVAFMRRSIERMNDEQRAAPDYSETLAKMNEALSRCAGALGWLRKQPAVQTTAQDLAQSINAAGETARRRS